MDIPMKRTSDALTDKQIEKSIVGEYDLEIKGKDVTYHIVNQCPMKVTKTGVYAWTGKEWFKMGASC